ncbi:phospho-N-acetylmuramoyl-pentapeptide-transferase [Ligilactobacillus pobuzihii]|uniref:phospho-N-acetylmuramoyl-pentapeptide- transferase n=1 Tax=Ligilactobacillus pobuzihii TaxID=449659 RepID=UPI0019D12F4C|nr:phospho-N-acetylmuramoyl-pentapeptide-transferase [Ligilactobacillus pobuzihii]MBN7275144.1 phospho-N-acetylmuramoyl-pentapeptide-transferase [Ligilactobacillus pobuzihii]
MSFLAMLGTALCSFILTIILTPFFINYAHKKKAGQMIREEGPKWHEKKSGTPTMGGLVFDVVIVVTAIVVPLIMQEMSSQILILAFILALYGFLGFFDDSIKLLKKQNEGLKAWQKLLGQIIGGVIFLIVYQVEGLPFSLNIFGFEMNVAWIYALFVLFWLIGFSNAVNLTDGIDGLVAGQATIAFGAYAVIAYVQNQNDVLIFCLAVIGALCGFFLFNKKPAKIFMGDMGSLALGGGLAAVSILVHHELSLLFIGLIFVFETASVILQVISFKTTGKRIFKMSPLHHHFELSGWSEWKIDTIFWSTGLIMAVLSLWVIL